MSSGLDILNSHLDTLNSFPKMDPIIQRSDGVFINLDEILTISSKDRDVINAMFYAKIKDLDRDKLNEFLHALISILLISVNSRKSADEIKMIRNSFLEEFPVMHSSLTIKEVYKMCYLGIRGTYNVYQMDSILTLANFSKWKARYIEDRNLTTGRLIPVINSIPLEQTVDFSKTEIQIEEIIKLKKIDEDRFKNECAKFSKVLPSFMYDLFVQQQKISKNEFEKHIEDAKRTFLHKLEKTKSENIIDLMEVLYGTDLNSYESKLLVKAKQLSIYNYLLSHEKN